MASCLGPGRTARQKGATLAALSTVESWSRGGDFILLPCRQVVASCSWPECDVLPGRGVVLLQDVVSLFLNKPPEIAGSGSVAFNSANAPLTARAIAGPAFASTLSSTWPTDRSRAAAAAQRVRHCRPVGPARRFPRRPHSQEELGEQLRSSAEILKERTVLTF